MRKASPAVIAAVLWSLSFGLPAYSQSPPAASEVRLTMEQTHVLKEFLLNDSAIPKAARADFQIGQKVPPDIAARDFPEAVAQKVAVVKAHRFFVGGGKIFIVSKDDTISEIIE